MTSPDRTPERVIEEAQKLLGIGENPPGSNCNVLTQRFGIGCVAWCDITYWTALFNAGFQKNGKIDMPGVQTTYDLGDAYVPATMAHFQAAGRFQSTPVPGAGEIHYWGGGEQNSHIAMYVKDYGDGTHLNIEGNHNNACEYVRRANNDSTIMGYCIPAYVTAPVQPTPQPEEEDMLRLFTHAGGEYIGVFGDWCRPIPGTPPPNKNGTWDFYVRAGVKVNDTDGTAEVQADVFSQMTKRPVAES